MNIAEQSPSSDRSKPGWAWLIARALLVGIGYEVLEGLIELVQRLFPALPFTAFSAYSLSGVATNIIAGIILTIALVPFALHIPYHLPGRIAMVAVPVYIIGSINNLVELIFFSAHFSLLNVLWTSVAGLIHAAGVGVLIAGLFPASPQAYTETPPGQALRQRSLLSWLWRVCLAALLYVPTYYTFGALIYPLVRPYYNSGGNLITPSVGTLLIVEAVRGLLYVLALLPALAVLHRSRWVTVLYLTLIIAALNSWEPLLRNAIWPVQLRAAHAAEITGDAIVQGITIGLLLALPAKTFRRREQ